MRKAIGEALGALGTEDGGWERPYPSYALAVPRQVRFDPQEAGILRWSAQAGWNWRDPSFEMLADFSELAEAPGDRITDYAGRYGVLMLCKHNLPRCHNPFSPSSVGLWCEPLWNESCGPYKHSGWEYLGIWRSFAREARAILKAAQILRSERGSMTAAEVYLLLYGREQPEADDAPRGVDWSYVRTAVNRWLDLGDVRPSLAHVEGKALSQLMIAYGMAEHFERNPGCGLFASLAVQLMLATSGDSIPYRCPCGTFFRPERANMAWCVKCRTNGGRSRAASKALYQRQRRNRADVQRGRAK